MRRFSRSLALVVAPLGLLGLVGCQEDNEKAGGGDTSIQKPANTPSPEEYSKQMQSANSGTPEAGAGSNIPGSTAAPPAGGATP